MSTPALKIETIAFRGYDPSAVPLQAGGTPVTGPEFVRTSRRLPAAFVAPAADGHITIHATLFCPELAGQTVDVHASRLDGAGHAIQDVECRPVTFDAAGQNAGIDFSAVMLRVGVDLDHVRWQWRFRHNGDSTPANITDHQIAVVLGEPEKPWTTGTPTCDTTWPLWEVLQHACTVARGAGTLHDAAVRITKAVFGVWGGPYYKWNAAAETFASDAGDPLAFDCVRFLSLLGAPPPAAPEFVDCSDIATILSTFASILGCPIQQVVLNNGLPGNPVRLVGHDEWSVKDFPLHEIAARVPLGSSPQVWDGCLVVSGDQTIGPGDPATELLPAGLDGAEYLNRLLRAQRKPFDKHIFIEPLSRPLGPLSSLVPRPAWNAHLEKIATDYGFSSWGAPDPRGVLTVDPATLAGKGWKVVIETAFPAPGLVDPDADAVARLVCTWTDEPWRRVRVTVYLCADADAARLRFVYLLGKFAERLRPLDGVPGAAFRSPDGRTVVGAIMNVAYKITDAGARVNATATHAPTEDAREVRAELTSRLISVSTPL